MSRATLDRPTLPPELDPRGPRRRRSSLRRLSLASFSLLSVLVLGLSSVGWFLYNQFDKNVTQRDWDVEGDRPAEVPGNLNILLLGDDSRDGTGDQYGGSSVVGIRSDTTIIAHFDKDGSVTLLSFPRDTLVTVPAKEDGTRYQGTPADGKDKVTNVLNYADVPGLIRTLEHLTQLKIDHTITVNLAGFKQMTDAIGGVDVCVLPSTHKERFNDDSGRLRVSTNTNDPMSGWVGGPGTVHVNGEQALAFVRQRHGLPDGDKDRIARQQQFLSKLLAKATSSGVLSNPVKINSLVAAVGKSLQWDLDNKTMLALAKRASQLGPGKVKFITVPTHVPLPSEGASDDKGTIGYHGNVLFVNTDELNTILAPMRPAPEDDPALADAPVVEPAQVSVATVVNSSGRDGLAGQTVTDLKALGFGGVMKASTGEATQAATEVRYPAGQEGAAKALVTRIPGALAVEDAALSGGGLSLVIGSSFTGVQGAGPAAAAPAVGPAASAAPAGA
ncbi:LCP family protein, partial [Frankia sp. CNm7]